MKELYILTDSTTDGLHPDDDGLLEALNDHSIKGVPVVWDEFTPTENSTILIRTPWDYALKREKFQELLHKIESTNSKLINSVDTVRWNMDKSYMNELEGLGIKVVPTSIVKKTKLLPETFNSLTYPIVLKPLVGAGGKDTFLINSAQELTQASALEGRDVMAQPYIESVSSIGEYSYLFFDGKFSHCILKTAKKNEFRVQEEHGGTVHKHTPSQAHLDMAIETYKKLNQDYCYARLDFVESGSELLLMELEVIEPQLFFTWAPDAITTFAKAIAKRIN